MHFGDSTCDIERAWFMNRPQCDCLLMDLRAKSTRLKTKVVHARYYQQEQFRNGNKSKRNRLDMTPWHEPTEQRPERETCIKNNPRLYLHLYCWYPTRMSFHHSKQGTRLRTPLLVLNWEPCHAMPSPAASPLESRQSSSQLSTRYSRG